MKNVHCQGRLQQAMGLLLTGAVLLTASSVTLAQRKIVGFGRDEYGQLGNGPVNDGSYRPRPRNVLGMSGIVAIQAGQDFSLALHQNGTLYAWGRNNSGQLGIGSTAQTNRPVRVLNLTGVWAIATGREHCLGLKSDGSVWAWGYNASGQLGNGTAILSTGR